MMVVSLQDLRWLHLDQGDGAAPKVVNGNTAPVEVKQEPSDVPAKPDHPENEPIAQESTNPIETTEGSATPSAVVKTNTGWEVEMPGDLPLISVKYEAFGAKTDMFLLKEC